ncbi:GNAT family N-acetyltransferase [Cohnella yongneupensis]|uniref:GNAT family N-acetyltransferase n=1 Tax=Cohnella yongneupensis TaxID=425006 RepID=A0ABW0QYD5_9BACL
MHQENDPPTNSGANDLHMQLCKMTEEEAQAVSEWRYPAPYDVYRWPAWADMLREGRELADPDIRREQYLSVRDAEGVLVGYIQLFALDRAIRLGVGLRPDLCDRGLGKQLIQLAIQEATRRKPGAEIDLEVEHWNKRANRAYEKAGFVITDYYSRRATHGIVNIYCMVWKPTKQA